jgi:hypothetical protein
MLKISRENDIVQKSWQNFEHQKDKTFWDDSSQSEPNKIARKRYNASISEP